MHVLCLDQTNFPCAHGIAASSTAQRSHMPYRTLILNKCGEGVCSPESNPRRVAGSMTNPTTSPSCPNTTMMPTLGAQKLGTGSGSFPTC